MTKPESCRGCPAYQDGQGFVPDLIIPGADTFVVAQNPGEFEERGQRVTGYIGKEPLCEPCPPQPLIGKTGHLMDTGYLPLAGLEPGGASKGNILKCRWRGGNTLPPSTVLIPAARYCLATHFTIPQGTKVILAMGDLARWALTGVGSPTAGGEEWRGWALPYRPEWVHGKAPLPSSLWTPGPQDLPVLMSLHLAATFRVPAYIPAVKRDWEKLGWMRRRTWPVPMPTVSTDPVYALGVLDSSSLVAFDTEYDPGTRALHRYSIFEGDRLAVIEAGAHPGPPFSRPRLLTQSAQADIPHALALGFLTHPWAPDRVEDLMLLHATLWAGWPHTLDYIGSLHARINRWKHLSQTNPIQYAAGDVVGTWDGWRGLVRETRADPQSWQVYTTLMRPLIPLIWKRRVRGIRVHPGKTQAVTRWVTGELARLRRDAQAVTGWPINLGSPLQVARQLYTTDAILGRSIPVRVTRGTIEDV